MQQMYAALEGKTIMTIGLTVIFQWEQKVM